NRRVLEPITQRDQLIVGIMIDEISRTSSDYRTRRADFTVDAIHGRVKDLRVNYTNSRNIRELAHGPGGIVVNLSLRVVGRPILIIQERVGDAAVGLVHANDITAGGKRARRPFSLDW